MGSLGDRLRQVIGGAVPRVSPGVGGAAGDPLLHTERRSFSPAGIRVAADALGGHVVERTEGAIILVDRHYPAAAFHGRARIGDIIETLLGGADALGLFGRVWPSCAGANREALCFFDLETTGLAGGAGTQAFLVGCAVIDAGGIAVRQFLLPGFDHERALLEELAAWAPGQDTLVTFNGRSFDLPLIETRYLFNRIAFPFADRPHLDMLHAARRLWRDRPAIVGPALDDESCRLSVLERHLAGVKRIGDVPGFEIPSRFFDFVRTGAAAPLEAVLEHNRIDLISLALVTARVMSLVQRGPSAAAHARECLGLGRLFERAGAVDEADACFTHAADLAARIGREPQVQAEALRRLAYSRRRAGRAHESAEAWRTLVQTPGCPAALRREARQALAIHHEHRSKDLEAARLFVLETIAEDGGTTRPEVEHRLRRLERKLQETKKGGLMAALDES